MYDSEIPQIPTPMLISRNNLKALEGVWWCLAIKIKSFSPTNFRHSLSTFKTPLLPPSAAQNHLFIMSQWETVYFMHNPLLFQLSFPAFAVIFNVILLLCLFYLFPINYLLLLILIMIFFWFSRYLTARAVLILIECVESMSLTQQE